jgi:acyl carrier protein
MTDDEIRADVLDSLSGIAPEADPATIVPGEPLRDQLDIDSMDFLNFAIALHERFGVEIPETDYPKLATLDGIVAYLTARV